MAMTEIDPSELHFLVLHYLAAGPCNEAAHLLEQQAIAHDLLPCRLDVFGNRHQLSYAELQLKYAHIGPEVLASLLQHAVTARKASTNLNLEGDQSLLTAGVESQLPPRLDKLSLCHKHALRLQGTTCSPAMRAMASTQQSARFIQHHKTIRGHKLAVYCIAFDRAGKHIITGSDDRLVKIWSVQTALLLRSCRGHDGEVTDLAVNQDSTIVASSSNDTTIRCWSLERDTMGHPVSVLVGHQAPVTYVDFNKAIPNALLSSSFDGTCRIWDATNSAWAPRVMKASAAFGPMKGVTRFGGSAVGPSNAPVQGSKPNTRSVDASAVGRHSDAAVTIRAASEAANGSIEHRLRSSDAPDAAAAASGTHMPALAGIGLALTPTPGLLVCGFSPDGSHIVAGSNDCHLYAWHWDIAAAADKGKGAAKQGFYNVVSEEDAARNMAPAAAADLEAVDWPEPQETCRLGGHVNDVLLLQFSHDGQSIATGSKDGTMRTWQRVRRRGKVLHSWENKHVLKCELDDAVVRKARQKRRAPPVAAVNQLAWSYDDLLVISSVSDNTLRVWDSHTGAEVQRLVGHQAQVHILECHPSDPRLAMSASYDGTTRLWNLYTGENLASFSTQQTRPDAHGSWTDHIQLVDGHWSPDGNSLVVSDVAGQWHMYSIGAPDLVKFARYDQFLESDYDRLTRDVNGAVIDDNTQQPPHLRPTRDYLVDIVAGRYAEPYQKAYRTDSVLQLLLKVAQGQGEWDTLGLPQALREYPPTVTAAGWVAQEAEGSDEDIDRAIQRAMHRAIAAEAALAAAVVAGEVDLTVADPNQEEAQPEPMAGVETVAEAAGQAAAEGAAESDEGRALNRASSERANTDDAEEDDADDGEEWEQWPDPDVAISSSDDDAAASESGDSVYSERGGAAGPRTRARRQANRRGLKRTRVASDRRAERARKRQRLQLAAYADVDSDEEEVGEEHDDMAGQRRLRSHRTAARQTDARAKKQKKKVRRQSGRANAGGPTLGGRHLDKYAWLQVSWRMPGVYVPQLGDEVVYLQVGHQKFLSDNNNKMPGPWTSLVSTQAGTRGQRMREVEPAEVVALEYLISDDGTSNTCAKLQLRLSDPGSPLVGRTFEVELPPPNCGHAEFVIPCHRFLASVQRRWSHGDRCQVFYPDDDDEAAATCQVWHGMVTESLSPGGSSAVDRAAEMQADPYGCGGLWESLMVGWHTPDQEESSAQGEASGQGFDEPTRQSPWELFDEGLDVQQAVQEGMVLTGPVAERLKQAIQTLSQAEQFEMFVELLPPEAAYPASDTGALMYYNTMVALPMSLSLVKDRLEQGYYRQVQGLLGDVAAIQRNATDFNGEDSQVAELAADLARRLNAAATGDSYDSGLSSDDAEISDMELDPPAAAVTTSSAAAAATSRAAALPSRRSQRRAAAEVTPREEEAGQGRARRGRAVEDEQLDLEEEDDEGPSGCKGRGVNQEQPHVEEDEEVDIMNSPLQQPWGHEVTRSRRSTRAQHRTESPLPSDSNTVFQAHGLSPQRTATQAAPRVGSRRHAKVPRTDPEAATNSRGINSHVEDAAAGASADLTAAGRTTRSSARQHAAVNTANAAPRPAISIQHHGGSNSDHDADGAHDGDAKNTMLPVEEQSNRRSLRSRSRPQSASDHVAAGGLSTSRLTQDSGAQLASDWHHATAEAQPTARLRRSTRAQIQNAAQQAAHGDVAEAAADAAAAADAEAADAEAAGPSQPASVSSPVSSREARAQNRAAKGWQPYSPELFTAPHTDMNSPAPEVSPVSSRETRAQHRAARNDDWQVYSPDLFPDPDADADTGSGDADMGSGDAPAVQRPQRRSARARSVDEEPVLQSGDTDMGSGDAPHTQRPQRRSNRARSGSEEPVMQSGDTSQQPQRRSSRAISVSEDPVVQSSVASHQAPTGIKIKLRHPAGAAKRAQARQPSYADEAGASDAAAAPRLRLSLRTRKS